jgi:16S rRNA A1518/A1519 N6-dimethyltransferase RsmA/KsgA/DIM1 with predicted DNA glycosylase/AP lyase activity
MVRAERLGERAGAVGPVVHQVLSARRKTLRKALERANVDADGVIAKLGLNPQTRAEELPPETFLAMFEAGLSGL